jgi:hypothetical protein
MRRCRRVAFRIRNAAKQPDTEHTHGDGDVIPPVPVVLKANFLIDV